MVDKTTLKRPTFHSRHIPQELLNFDTPVGNEVRQNGLCDVLDGDMPRRLRDCGVEVIETRLVWWELEKQPGQLDFSRLDRDIRKIEDAGLKPAVFAWFQHPPEWYDPQHQSHVRFRCLEHDQDSTILSQWDRSTLEGYDRLYGRLAQHMGGRLAFLYAGISGDFGEYCYPSGVKHYFFSPDHNHEGFWCGDRRARESFAQSMEQKYDTISNLNHAWHTRYTNWHDDLMPPLPFSAHPLRRRMDFAHWYTNALYEFSDAACAIVRRHFPDTNIGIPLGFPEESLAVGQIKSMGSKLAARHHMIARWTGMAYLQAFERSNVLARRFASAAHFYGADFATEAALTLTKENAAHGLYESLANGATIIHDDPQNIIRAEDIHRKLRPKIFVDPPTCSRAVLYPLYDELLQIDDFEIRPFIDRAAALRVQCDYEICDHCMIDDGFLQNISDLLIIVSGTVPQRMASQLEAFISRGGRVWLCANSNLSLLSETGEMTDLPIPARSTCEPILGANAGGLYQIKSPPLFESFDALISQHGVGFYTVHEHGISRYHPATTDIERLPSSTAAQGRGSA